MRETGFCSGIENYSMHLAGLKPGQPPCTLLDYFPDDFLMIVDESHITIPQVGYMPVISPENNFGGLWLRLPSVKDNRPLNLMNLETKIDQALLCVCDPECSMKRNMNC